MTDPAQLKDDGLIALIQDSKDNDTSMVTQRFQDGLGEMEFSSIKGKASRGRYTFKFISEAIGRKSALGLFIFSLFVNIQAFTVYWILCDGEDLLELTH